MKGESVGIITILLPRQFLKENTDRATRRKSGFVNQKNKKT